MGTALVALWFSALLVAANAAYYYIHGGGVGMDAHAYWLAGRETQPYGPAPEQRDAYLYSPLFAQVMRPLALAPWPLFCAAWLVLVACAYLWLTRPLPIMWRVPVLLLCIPELLIGNIYSFLAVSLALLETSPLAVTLPLLTKITPGGVGLLWLAVRRRWSDLGIALAGTVLLVMASMALDFGLWRHWADFLRHHSAQGGLEFPMRVIAAAVVVVVAARLGRRWPLAFAFYLAMPLAGLGIQTVTAMVAGIRLAVADRQRPLAESRAPSVAGLRD